MNISQIALFLASGLYLKLFFSESIVQPLSVGKIEDFSKSILTIPKFSIPTNFSLLNPFLVLECGRFSIISIPLWFKLCVLSSPELVRSLNFIKLNMSFHNRSQLTTKVDVRKIVNQCKYVLLQMCITLSDELSHVSTWIKSDLD